MSGRSAATAPPLEEAGYVLPKIWPLFCTVSLCLPIRPQRTRGSPLYGTDRGMPIKYRPFRSVTTIRIRNRMFLPLTHLGSRTNLRSGFSHILLPKRLLLQPPKYLHPAKAVGESDCCRLQSRASDSTLFRYSTQKTGIPSFCDEASDIERRPHEPERTSAVIGDRSSIPFPIPFHGMFSGADRLDFPEKILILHNYDFVSSCRFVCITK